MATSYAEVFSAFMAKKNDYEISLLDDDVIEADNTALLNRVIPQFRYPRVDIWDKDDVRQCFNNELTYEEIHVLSQLMICEWLKRTIYNTDVLIQKFGETDFEFKSQANHLKAQVQAYENLAKIDAKTAISNYSKSYKGTMFNYQQLAGKK